MWTKVLYNKQILPLYYKLGINWQPLPDIQAGQFIMLRINDRIDPLLRRPFGVYKILGQKKEAGIEIVYKVVGKGTRMMTGLKPGDAVDLLGPLGNGFPTPLSSPFAKGGQRGLKFVKGKQQGLKIVMVAGGIGIAPFYMLAKNCRQSAIGLKLLFGGRSKDDLPGLEDFKKLDIAMNISTQDGSVGEKGLATELLKLEIGNRKSEIIYACGPKGMLKAVAKMAKDADIPCYVSLDTAMACGMGVCLGCAVKVRGQEPEVRSRKSKTFSPYKMVCKDGPVFDAREIEWEEV